MKSFQQRRGFRNILHSRPVLALFAVLAAFFAWAIIGFMGKMIVTRENRIIAEKKVAELEKEKDKLSGDIAKLKTEEGIEESIREKFGLAKEGEKMIVVVDDKNPPPPKDPAKEGLFSFIKNWFKR